MDFEHSARSVELAERLRAFIDEQVTPAALRIADGPDEVHSMAIARRELRRHNQTTR